MAVKLADKMNETKTVEVTWGADKVEVSYFINAVTPALLEEVDKAAQADDMSILGTLLEPVLEWWDVLDDKGKRIPTDAATIRTIPMHFINAVQREIERDQNPPEDGTSDAG